MRLLGISMVYMFCLWIPKLSQAQSSSILDYEPIVDGATNYVLRAPEIRFDRKVINLGYVKVGTVINKEFEFSNVGGVPLEIKRIRPSCSCAECICLPQDFIGPGQDGKIMSKLVIEKNGPFKFYIRVMSNSTKSVHILIVQGIGYS